MTVILDPGLKALMDEEESVAVLWQDAQQKQITLLAKAPDPDVKGFKGKVPIQTYWELGCFECGSVLRMHITIFDRPDNPYRFETFINVASPEQFACVSQLLSQDALPIHFFDRRTEHVLSKEINFPWVQRQQLGRLVEQALEDRTKLGEIWDFDRAKALFQVANPL